MQQEDQREEHQQRTGDDLGDGARRGQRAAGQPLLVALHRLDRRDQRRREAERRAELRPLRERAAQLVLALDRLNEELAGVDAELADPELYAGAARDRLQTLLRRQGELRQRGAVLEADWIAAEEALEGALAER